MNNNNNNNNNFVPVYEPAFAEFERFPHANARCRVGRQPWLEHIREVNNRGRPIVGNAATAPLVGDAYIPSNEEVEHPFGGMLHVPHPIKADHVALTEYVTRIRYHNMLTNGAFTAHQVLIFRRVCANKHPGRQQTVEWIAEFWLKSLPLNREQINNDLLHREYEREQQRKEQERREKPWLFNMFSESSAAEKPPPHRQERQQQQQQLLVGRDDIDYGTCAAAAAQSSCFSNTDSAGAAGDRFVHSMMQVTQEHLDARDGCESDQDLLEALYREGGDGDEDDAVDASSDYGHDSDNDGDNGGEEEGHEIDRQHRQWNSNRLVSLDIDDEDDDGGDTQQQQPPPLLRAPHAPLGTDTGVLAPLERTLFGGDAERARHADDDCAVGGALPVAGADGRMHVHSSILNYLYRLNSWHPCEALHHLAYIEYSVSVDCSPLPPADKQLLLKLTADAQAAAAISTDELRTASASAASRVVLPDFSFLSTHPSLRKYIFFGIEHPLFLTHVQHHRRTVVVPKLAGKLLRGVSSASSTLKRRDAFAEFAGILFCPFSVSAPPEVRNWSQLETWIARLDIVNNLRHRSFLAYLHQLSSLHVPREMQQLLALWRLKNASNKYQGHTNPNPRVADPHNLHPQAFFDRSSEDAHQQQQQQQQQPSKEDILAQERARQAAAAAAAPSSAGDLNFAKATQCFDDFFAAVDASRGRARHEDDARPLHNAFIARLVQAHTSDECSRKLDLLSELGAATLERAAKLPGEDGAGDDVPINDNNANTRRDADPEDAADRILTDLHRDLENRIKMLNVDQRAIFDMVCDAINRGDTRRIAIHGRGGCGKSFLANVIYDWCLLTHGKKPWFCAFTGCAAQLLRDGQTISRTFSLRTFDKFKVFPDDFNHWPKIDTKDNPGAHEARCADAARAGVVFIDEMSMIPAQMLHHVVHRLEHWCNRTYSTPGFPQFILAGDFFQLAPVGASNLIGPVNDVEHNARWGRDFFQFECRHFYLDIQQRTTGLHTTHMNTLTSNRALGNVLDEYETLDPSSADDIRDFADATIIVQHNRMRRSLNISSAQRFCLAAGVPLVCWRRPVDGVDNPMSDPIFADVKSQYWAYFAPDAPAMVLDNICTTFKISNGTMATMHSLSWDSEVDAERAAALIAAGRPGERVELPVPPTFVNVVLKSSFDLSAALGDAIQHLSTDELKAYILPIPLKKVTDDKGSTTKKSSKDVDARPEFSMHSVDLAFALTFHKVQGQTLSRIIIDLNRYHSQILLCMLYVGLSRVRDVNHVRILSFVTADQPGLLRKLQWSDKVWNFYSVLDSARESLRRKNRHGEGVQLVRLHAPQPAPLRMAPAAVVNGDNNINNAM